MMHSRGFNFPRPSPRQGARGFTLIEILIVIVILGILATIVIPQFSSASASARENTMKDQLRYLRTQIVVYKAQHHDVPAGYPNGNRSSTPTSTDFVAQMTQPTNEFGATNATPTAVYHFGPYLGAMPANPLNNLNGVLIVGDSETMPAPSDVDYGWIYQPSSGIIIANSSGADTSGTLYKDY